MEWEVVPVKQASADLMPVHQTIETAVDI